MHVRSALIRVGFELNFTNYLTIHFLLVSVERRKVTRTIKKAEKYEIPLDPFETKKRKASAKESNSKTTSGVLSDKDQFDSDE